MATATLTCPIVPPADLRAATETMRRYADEVPEVRRCAHTLIDSVTAVIIATEARHRWLANGKRHPDETLRINDLISAESQRAVATASRFRTLVTSARLVRTRNLQAPAMDSVDTCYAGA